MATGATQAIHRVQADLATMRAALGVDGPFDRATVAAWWGVAGVSALGVVAAGTGARWAVTVTGAAALALVLSVLAWMVRTRARRAEAPVIWREMRRVTLVKLVAGPILAVFLLGQLRLGVPVASVASYGAVLVGIAALIYAVAGSGRSVGWGLAVPLLALGVLAPLVAPAHLPVAAAATGVVAGVSCAAIAAAQIRRRRAARPS